MFRVSLPLLLASALTLGCEQTFTTAPRSVEIANATRWTTSTEDAAQTAGARDLHCALTDVKTSSLQLSRDTLYVADGCGQRAVYAPVYRYPGPVITGLVLISKFAP
jgi:hypothetical protein